MQNFASRLKKENIYVDVICIRTFVTERNSSLVWPCYIEKCFSILQTSHNRFLRGMFRRLAIHFFLKKLFLQYDVVDFHAYLPSSYNGFVNYCVNKRVKFDITLWGSDLMRATDENKSLMKFGFDNCFRIKMTSNLYDKMQEYYGNTYGDKYREVYFGSSEVEQIDNINETDISIIKKQLYGETGDKKIIVCGYNGYDSQNHEKMIAALCGLNDAEKGSLHVVLPMTYGARPDYLCKIKNMIEKSGFSYTVLDHFLDAKEVAVIRKTANVVINVQDTDALSDSLKGHLYCGNICIFGEWLSYNIFSKNGIYYIKTSMDDIIMHLKEVLDRYYDYRQRCIGNQDMIKKLFSWEATMKNQIAVYGE